MVLIRLQCLTIFQVDKCMACGVGVVDGGIATVGITVDPPPRLKGLRLSGD